MLEPDSEDLKVVCANPPTPPFRMARSVLSARSVPVGARTGLQVVM